MLAWQSQSIDYKLRLEKPASPQTPDEVGRAVLIFALISASACFVLTWGQKDGWPEMDTDRSKYAWTLL